MEAITYMTLPEVSGQHTVITAIELTRVWSATLVEGDDVAAVCNRAWERLAGALCAAPDPIEGVLVVSAGSGRATERAFNGFVLLGRGPTDKVANLRSRQAQKTLRRLLDELVEFAEFRAVSDQGYLGELYEWLRPNHALELRRSTKRVDLETGCSRRAPAGFGLDCTLGEAEPQPCVVPHLFPWRGGNDTWEALVRTLRRERGPAALLAHFRTFRQTPEECRREAYDRLSRAERGAWARVEDTGGTPLTRRTELLREALDRRVAILDGPQIAMRVFLGGHRSLSQALVATAAEAVDGTGHNNESHRRTLRGGVDSEPVDPSSITAPFDEPTLDVLFGPMEATVALRTPMPVDGDLPGVAIKSARTAHLTGRRGRDCALGYSRHQGRRRRVGLEAEDRFRHTYLLGQTGTGKSTLMANMILQDLRRGRGVAVLDPHGNLVESVLERMPEERSGDVVLFDVTDVERPIPFNILSVDADTPYEHRQQRDLVIDELHRYVHHHFSPDMVGPMFETHLRGTLGLLMGSRPPRGRRAPNLMLLNGVYSNESLRERLVEECRGEDVLLDEFIRQVDGSPSDWSFSGMASYVTSKFNRFIYDRTLRNILCQRDILDVESIVDEGKVLLVNLGKGRFGDVAAGLLAGQIVARIRRAVMRQGTGGRPFYLYADEFQLFADAHFAEMLAEARKFGLALTVAHQFTDQLPEEALHSVLGNVGTKIFFRVGPRDASTVAPLLHPRFDEHDVVSLPNYRSYVQSAGCLGQLPFSLDTLPQHGKADAQRAYEVRAFSRNKYGRPRQLVEKEIRDTWNAYVRDDADADEDAGVVQLREDLFGN